MLSLQDILDVMQGASNSAAATVSTPVDAIAWALRKSGVPVPMDPFMGSKYMERVGLLGVPVNRTAGLLGESAGAILPIVAAANASRIASGLLAAQQNIGAPSSMARQSERGMALFDPNTPGSVIKQQAESLADAIRAKGWTAEVQHSGSAAGPSSYINAYDPQTGRTLRDLRLSSHSKGAWNSQFVNNINTDDFPSILARLDELRAAGETAGARAIRLREQEAAAKVAARAKARLDSALAKQAAGEALSQKEINALKAAGLPT